MRNSGSEIILIYRPKINKSPWRLPLDDTRFLVSMLKLADKLMELRILKKQRFKKQWHSTLMACITKPEILMRNEHWLCKSITNLKRQKYLCGAWAFRPWLFCGGASKESLEALVRRLLVIRCTWRANQSIANGQARRSQSKEAEQKKQKEAEQKKQKEDRQKKQKEAEQEKKAAEEK